MSEQHKEQTDKMTKLEIELQGRVGVLEKWRWIIIGGSIVVGFIIQKMLYYNKVLDIVHILVYDVTHVY